MYWFGLTKGTHTCVSLPMHSPEKCCKFSRLDENEIICIAMYRGRNVNVYGTVLMFHFSISDELGFI